ncbi:MAG: translation initiation factor IF-3 [Planctomycetota bacterium]|nr:translation initiation factor IF-3 [Planctomycetota bacterium]
MARDCDLAQWGDSRKKEERTISERLRINAEIKAKTIRVIGPDGAQLGIMLVEQARMKATELELDLVEVAPKADPPVCRIMDYGKHIYHEQKKEQKARKKAHAHDVKEVRLSFKIGKHDLDIKVQHAKEFLAEGHRVQFTMIYKGREIAHQSLGEQILKGVVVQLGDSAKVERPPFREGKRVGLILAPKVASADKPEKPDKSGPERATAPAVGGTPSPAPQPIAPPPAVVAAALPKV